jgi:hypothetical protein
MKRREDVGMKHTEAEDLMYIRMLPCSLVYI